MIAIEKAILLATKVHAGQKDFAGEPYILHPLRVMLNFENLFDRVLAVLHDVLEDSDITLDDLRKEGIPDDLIIAIDHITHRKGEDYYDYINRLTKNPIAKRVKQIDLMDNIRICRSINPEEVDLSDRIERYRRALEIVSGFVK